MVLVLLLAAGTWFATRQHGSDAGGAGGLLPLRPGAGGACHLDRRHRGGEPSRHSGQGRGLPGAPRDRRCGGVRQDRHRHDRRTAAGGGARRARRRSARPQGARRQSRARQQPSGQPGAGRAGAEPGRQMLHDIKETRGLGVVGLLGERDRGARPCRAVRGARRRRSPTAARSRRPDRRGGARAASSSAGCCSPTSRAPRRARRSTNCARSGLRRQLLLTGDRATVARRIGDIPGPPNMRAEALPAQKMTMCWTRSEPATARWWWATASTTRWR